MAAGPLRRTARVQKALAVRDEGLGEGIADNNTSMTWIHLQWARKSEATQSLGALETHMQARVLIIACFGWGAEL